MQMNGLRRTGLQQPHKGYNGPNESAHPHEIKLTLKSNITYGRKNQRNLQ